MENGRSQTETTLDLTTEKGRAIEREAIALSELMRAKMSPPGALKLGSAVLEKRRLEHGITDAHFRAAAAFDAVLVKQLEVEETHGDGYIYRTDAAKIREQEGTWKGIVISAGLKALDELRSHGIDLGHIVYFIKHVSCRIQVDSVGGHPEWLHILSAGDIKASVDLAEAMREGTVRVENVFDKNGAPEHRINMRNPETGEFDQKPIGRREPWISEDV